MIYKFIDNNGTFIVKDPQRHNLYFPLTNHNGNLLSSISPNLAGDIKKDNDHFLTPPASIIDLKSNLLCRRDFFIKLDSQTLRLSYPYKDTLEAGFLYHKIIKETGSLRIEIINFIPYDLAVEVMWVKVKNMGRKKINLIPTSFIPLYARAEKNLRDHRHVTSLLNRITLDKYGIFVRPTMVFDERAHYIDKTIYFVLGFQDKGSPPLGQFPTFDYFCGQGDLVFPSAIENDVLPLNHKLPEFDGKEACAAFRFRKKPLNRFEEINYFLLMGIDTDVKKIKNIFLKLNSSTKIKQSLEATRKYWLNYLSYFSFDFKDKNFNNWLFWVKMQPTLRKLFGNSFLPHFDYGKGGRGWRDLWQDSLALMLSEPDKARPLILNNFKGIRIDGSNATIITKEQRFLSDRNRINRIWMDHGIWPYLTLSLYINKIGDPNILLKDATYFRDHLLKRNSKIDFAFSQKDYLLRDKNNKVYQGSILEHLLIQHLTAFFNVGRHNIIRLENGDWNDGLDMAAQFGESVAFTFMYAHNLRELCMFLDRLKEKTKTIIILEELTLLLDRLNSSINYLNYKEKQRRLEEYLEKTKDISGKKLKIKTDALLADLKDKSEHLFRWLREKEYLSLGFFNGYYDNKGRRVEGKFRGKLRMLLPAQVFAIMSGVAGEFQVREVWASIKRYLKDSKLGGFRLNTDFKSLYPDLGRSFGFSYGDKENGAFFNHMVIMLAKALYRQGFSKEGFEVISSVYKMATTEQAKIYPLIPEYFNNEGQGLYLYLTGSASWYIHVLIEEILGIKFIWGDIILEPKLLYGNFFKDNIEVRFNLQLKTIKIILIRQNREFRAYQIKEVFLNDKKIIPKGYRYIIKKESLKKKNNTLRVYLG